jgi:hypothetical protein
VLEQKGVVVCSLQEHRICREAYQTEEVTKKVISSGWTMVSTSADNAGGGGVEFMLAPAAVKALDKAVSVLPRVLRLQFSTAGKRNPHKCHLVGTYAPTNEATDEVKDRYYKDSLQWNQSRGETRSMCWETLMLGSTGATAPTLHPTLQPTMGTG